MTYIVIKHYLFNKPTSKASKASKASKRAKLNKITHEKLLQELEEKTQLVAELEEKINKLLKVYLYEFAKSKQQDKLLDEILEKRNQEIEALDAEIDLLEQGSLPEGDFSYEITEKEKVK